MGVLVYRATLSVKYNDCARELLREFVVDYTSSNKAHAINHALLWSIQCWKRWSAEYQEYLCAEKLTIKPYKIEGLDPETHRINTQLGHVFCTWERPSLYVRHTVSDEDGLTEPVAAEILKNTEKLFNCTKE